MSELRDKVIGLLARRRGGGLPIVGEATQRKADEVLRAVFDDLEEARPNVARAGLNAAKNWPTLGPIGVWREMLIAARKGAGL